MNVLTATETIKSFGENPGSSGSPEVATVLVSASNESARPTLVIGDIHGHFDRLEALLRQEGVIGWCDHCDGTGIVGEPCHVHADFCPRNCKDTEVDCANCRGDGVTRINHDVEVVLLGDLGHFGLTGSPTGDVLTWYFATEWVDVILWGNHDRAMVEDQHAFRDFHRHPQEALHYFKAARSMGKLKLAHTSHGYLFTHAGLHVAFRDQDVVPEIKTDPRVFCDWINAAEDPNAEVTGAQMAVRDAISRTRGGGSHAGGILWRDISEKLYDRWPQVFGHSADHEEHAVRMCLRSGHTRKFEVMSKPNSYCVDVGGKGDKPGDNCLAGIWLPEERIVRVDL